MECFNIPKPCFIAVLVCEKYKLLLLLVPFYVLLFNFFFGCSNFFVTRGGSFLCGPCVKYVDLFRLVMVAFTWY
jgi:hypothetical protein